MNMFNRTKRIIRPLVLALAIGVMPAAVVSASSASAAPFCGIFWGSLAKSSDQVPAAAITNVRAGRHTCFDRMVVDINGKYANIVGGHAGYYVRYVRDVFEDPRGAAGAAAWWCEAPDRCPCPHRRHLHRSAGVPAVETQRARERQRIQHLPTDQADRPELRGRHANRARGQGPPAVPGVHP
jgi:hypothetical protein